eukprot:3158690-Amphidinium_carterae.1
MRGISQLPSPPRGVLADEWRLPAAFSPPCSGCELRALQQMRGRMASQCERSSLHSARAFSMATQTLRTHPHRSDRTSSCCPLSLAAP